MKPETASSNVVPDLDELEDMDAAQDAAVNRLSYDGGIPTLDAPGSRGSRRFAGGGGGNAGYRPGFH